jgi:hypothetical protein
MFFGFFVKKISIFILKMEKQKTGTCVDNKKVEKKKNKKITNKYNFK